MLRAAASDIAVVVSDNSTEGAHREQLEAFCASRPADKVTYIRPAEPLPMAEHWEWLWQEVRRRGLATHLAYLTDRMAFTAGALDELMAVVEAVPDRVISYQHDTVEDRSVPVELVQPQWTGRLLELDSRKLIERSSRARYGNELPRMLNSIAPVATLEAIERRFGDVFLSISPDYCFAYRSLAVCDSILYYDRSCIIEYGVGRSAGISYAKGRPNEHARRFQDELAVPRFGATPEPAFETVANAIFQEYCAIREQLGGDRFPPLDRWGYLLANAVSVDRLEDEQWRARGRELLRRHGWTRLRSVRHAAGLSIEIAGYFLRHPSALARSVRRQFLERPPGTPFAFLLPRIGLNPRIRDELRFGSSEEAIAYADAHPRARTPYAWHVHRLSRGGAVLAERPGPRVT